MGEPIDEIAKILIFSSKPSVKGKTVEQSGKIFAFIFQCNRET